MTIQTDLSGSVEGLRAAAPGIAAQAVADTLADGRLDAAFARTGERRVLQRAVEAALAHFPAALRSTDPPYDEITEYYQMLGVAEQRQGRAPRHFQHALSLCVAAAVPHLVNHARLTGVPLSDLAVGELLSAALVHLDRLRQAFSEGYEGSRYSGPDHRREVRRRLVDLLLSEECAPLAVRELATQAGWRPPQGIAVVVLARAPRVMPLPPEVLSGLHLPEPCLIFPDPDGPGRGSALRAILGGKLAAVGPTVEPGQARVSQQLARRALELAREGFIPGASPLRVKEQLAHLVIAQDLDLTRRLADRALAPLAEVPAGQRRRLVETLAACFACQFNANSVGARLHVHPQTVRYRLRKLENLLGDRLRDPSHALDLTLAAHAWILLDNATPCA